MVGRVSPPRRRERERGDGVLTRTCLAEPVAENRQERRCDHLGSDGGAAGLIVGLMIVLDVMVASCMLLHRGVASECIESEASPTPAIMAMEPVGRRGVLGRLHADRCEEEGLY